MELAQAKLIFYSLKYELYTYPKIKSEQSNVITL